MTTVKLPYLVYIDEGGQQFVVAAFSWRDRAVRYALSCVDDALPRNTAVVVDLATHTQVGYAAMAGDGGEYFETTPDAPSRFRGDVVPA
jgi:hypothetical protein